MLSYVTNGDRPCRIVLPSKSPMAAPYQKMPEGNSLDLQENFGTIFFPKTGHFNMFIRNKTATLHLLWKRKGRWEPTFTPFADFKAQDEVFPMTRSMITSLPNSRARYASGPSFQRAITIFASCAPVLIKWVCEDARPVSRALTPSTWTMQVWHQQVHFIIQHISPDRTTKQLREEKEK